MELVARARALATAAHSGQVRKTDGSPYIHHPEAVAAQLERYGFSPVVVAAALVHDVLEDTPVTEAELREELGDAVVAIVTAVSEDKALPWRFRKEQYIAAVVEASPEAKAVSVADKIHNAESLIAYHTRYGSATWEKFNRGREDKLWFERALLSALEEVWQHPLLSVYAGLVEKMEALD